MLDGSILVALTFKINYTNDDCIFLEEPSFTAKKKKHSTSKLILQEKMLLSQNSSNGKMFLVQKNGS